MIALSALFIGLLSGLLITFSSLILIPTDTFFKSSPALVPVVFFSGLIVTTYIVAKGASSASKVWARGALIGAAEWLGLGFAIVVLSGRTVMQVTEHDQSTAAVAGTGLFSLMGLGLVMFMVIICLVAWFIGSRMQTEFQPDVRDAEPPPSGIRRRKPLFLLFFLLIPSLAFADFVGLVVGITDGDTISVMHEGKAEKIRLNGIDCPDKGQAYGQRAKQLASELAFNKTVLVKEFGKDRYGRTIGDVLVDEDVILNHQLVGAGLCWWYRKYAPTNAVLEQLETEAREAKRGLWIEPKPMAPWDWRKGGRDRRLNGDVNPNRQESH